jgi:hypothetical protein
MSKLQGTSRFGHFVPGYYQPVHPGQNHSPIEAPRISVALMSFNPGNMKNKQVALKAKG